MYHLSTPFDIIIKDIIDKLSDNNSNKGNIIEHKNIINLIYYKNSESLNSNKIFGSNFVKNNKGNIALIINGKKSELIEKYDLKNGINNIQIIINNKLTNLESMFKHVISINTFKYRKC